MPTLAYSFQEHARAGKFNKKKALELGIPEGKLFSTLQKGEKIKLGSRTITPDMVLGKTRPGRKITISGDTIPCKRLIELAKKSDILIHDATFDTSLEKKANEYGHSTAKQAAEIAVEAQVKKLVLTHISPRYKDTKLIEKEAKNIFQNTIIASDLMEVELKLVQ